MATVQKTNARGEGGGSARQLRRDRITGALVLAILAALVGLMIWLASLGDVPPENLNDYWPMMP